MVLLQVRWKRTSEEARRENAILREQQRLEHIATVDLQTALKKEQRRNAELEYHQQQIVLKEQQRREALGLANARGPSAAAAAVQQPRAPAATTPAVVAAAPPPQRVAEVAMMQQPSSSSAQLAPVQQLPAGVGLTGGYLQPTIPHGYWVGPAWGQLGPGTWAVPQAAPRLA